MRVSQAIEIRSVKLFACLLWLLLEFTGTDAFQQSAIIRNVLNNIMTTTAQTPNILDFMEKVSKVATSTTPSSASNSHQLILTWETDVEAHIREALQDRDPSKPYMVGVVGIPGSGKSTSAEILTANLQDVGCALLPADGYHLCKNELQARDNGVDLIWRRGAPDTFDATAMIRDLKSIRQGHDEECILIPGFDHAVGDPTPNAHCFNRMEHKVVICEGLYLLHDADDFEEVRDLFDMTIFVDASIDICMDRLKIRNQCIPGYTREEISYRVDVVDRINAQTVRRSANRADLVVPSATSPAVVAQ